MLNTNYGLATGDEGHLKCCHGVILALMAYPELTSKAVNKSRPTLPVLQLPLLPHTTRASYCISQCFHLYLIQHSTGESVHCCRATAHQELSSLYLSPTNRVLVAVLQGSNRISGFHFEGCFLSLVWIPQKGYRYFNGEVIPRSRSRDNGNGIGQEENPVKEFAMKIITIVFS